MKNMNKGKKNNINLIKKKPAFVKASQEMDVLVRLAVAVNEARKLKGWSQQALAKKAGTTQKVVSRVENADMDIGLNLLQRFARSLGVELQFGRELLVRDTTSSVNTSDTNKVTSFVEITSPKTSLQCLDTEILWGESTGGVQWNHENKKSINSYV